MTRPSTKTRRRSLPKPKIEPAIYHGAVIKDSSIVVNHDNPSKTQDECNVLMSLAEALIQQADAVKHIAAAFKGSANNAIGIKIEGNS